MAATPKRNTPTKRRTPSTTSKKRKTPSITTPTATTATTTTSPDLNPHPHRIDHRTTTLPPLISDVTTAISAVNTFLQTHDTLLLPSLTLALHSSLSTTSTSLSHLRSLLSLPSPSPPPLPPTQLPLPSPPSSPWFERFVLSSITDSDPRWAQTFRMSKPTFSLLSSTLSRSLSSALPDIPPHFAFGCALYRLAHGASFSFIARRFGFSSKDACRAFYTVCKVICADLGGYFGNFREGITDILMSNCCGVLGFEKFGIDGGGEVLGEDGFLIVQALVDCNGRFLDVSAGWPSIFSPVSVLRQSRLYSVVEESKELLNGPEVELFNGHSVPQYVLGESWYRSLPWVVTPFTRKGEGLGLSSSELMFNEVHRRAMGFVKVAFGRVRANWQLLNRRWKDEFVEFLPFIFTTACLLNNFLLKHGEALPDVDVGSAEETEEEVSVCDGDVSETAAKIRDLLALHLNQVSQTRDN